MPSIVLYESITIFVVVRNISTQSVVKKFTQNEVCASGELGVSIYVFRHI